MGVAFQYHYFWVREVSFSFETGEYTYRWAFRPDYYN